MLVRTSGGAFPQPILRGREKELERIITKALRANSSKITYKIAAIRGFGSAKVLHLLNNICSQIDNCQYLEFGTWFGRSLMAASRGNNGTFVGVDNFSGIDIALSAGCRHIDIRAKLHETISVEKNIFFHEINYLDFTPQEQPFEVFFYDADHSEKGTAAALLHVSLSGMLTSPAIILIDDYENPYWNVADGVRAGLELGRYEVCEVWILPKIEGYHEGLWMGIVHPFNSIKR